MAAHIGIIGAGQVGAAAAYLLSATPGIGDIVLVDLDEARAAGEAADIGHAAAFGSAARVQHGTYEDLEGAQVVVITAGASLKPGQTRLELLGQNIRIVGHIIESVLKVAPDTILLFATNPVDVMPAIAVRHFGIAPGRAIGTGCALDSIRFRDRLARYLEVAPSSVHASVLGEHGDSEVLHWSSAQIGGLPIIDFAQQIGRPIDAAMKAQIAEDVRTAAYRIKEGKGVSNFGIGGCIARLVRALALAENSVFSVSTYLPELLGVAETCISLPHVLGRGGASKPLLPPLDNVETEALKNSAEVLAGTIKAGMKTLQQ
ncbi:L-lactate dehydrogenase [Pseudoroseomonas deserti]|uniref:L-lactate dehydrogenase n=1 Tax=Teichococcus deserti TaxID=1817963 RepID=A0A1V2GZV9_9PROT|nr:L-lactate dehydrogenase [Pseudoroseomonas deserti]ONG50220.1 L-lactate dehydrogenase [Pseudoroseomonas deserti]